MKNLKSTYLAMLERAWSEALHQVAQNILQHYIGEHISLNNLDCKPDNQYLVVFTDLNSKIFKDVFKSRSSQIKHLRQMQELGLLTPCNPFYDTGSSYFPVEDASAVQFARDYWLNQGIPIGLVVKHDGRSKFQTVPKPKNLSELIDELRKLLLNKFPLPEEIKAKLSDNKY